MAEPVPVVLCGRSPAIATSVKIGLMPEYEVIHVILSPPAAVSEILTLLKGETPPASETENLGTRHYAKRPAAIIFGGGYEDDHVSEIRETCKGLIGLPWLRPDLSTPKPPLGPEYGKAMVQRVKVCLRSLAEKGMMTEDAIVYF